MAAAYHTPDGAAAVTETPDEVPSGASLPPHGLSDASVMSAPATPSRALAGPPVVRSGAPSKASRISEDVRMRTGLAGTTMRAYIWQTVREIGRSKVTYCVGVSSCLIVVLVSAVMQTLLGQAPLIFLREAETRNAEIDMRSVADDWTRARYQNYTLVSELLAAAPTEVDGEFSYHSPRLSIDGVAFQPGSCDGQEDADPADSVEDNAWMYEMPGAETYRLAGSPEYSQMVCWGSCLSERCSMRQNIEFVLLDSARERRMNVGRRWPYSDIPAGQAVIREDVARALSVAEGDYIHLGMQARNLLRAAFRPDSVGNFTADTNFWSDLLAFYDVIAIPVKVHGIFSETLGKVKSKEAVVMEYSTFAGFVAPRLNPFLRYEEEATDAQRAQRAKPDANLYEYADEIIYNLPPESRLATYTWSNYDTVQEGVIAWAARLVYILGFNQVAVDLELLDNLRSRRFVSLYLGLILNILLIVLSALSAILIYSLLMINVQGRQFELAVRRMLGTPRIGVVFLLVLQALSYALPAWVLGLLLAEVISGELLDSFRELSGIPLEPGLTGDAIVLATVLVASIPLFASIGPIRLALSKNLRDALDVTRPKAAAVKVTIERADDGSVSWSVVAVGVCCATFGFCVYYLLPLSLLSLDLSLFFNIFLWILIGMLAGLVGMALNLQTMFEQITVYMWFFWERPFMRQLTLKNLVGHRMRNRKTMIMYALSISFIVLIAVAAEMELQSATFETQQEEGVPIRVRWASWGGSTPTWATVRRLEQALDDPEIKPLIANTAWVSQPLRDAMWSKGSSNHYFSNVGRVYTNGRGRIRAVSPSLRATIFEDFVTEGELPNDTGLDLTESLYTARGSQGGYFSVPYEANIGVGPGDKILLHYQLETSADGDPVDDGAGPPPEEDDENDGDTGSVVTIGSTDNSGQLTIERHRLRNLGTMESFAYLRYWGFPTNRDDDVMVSFPTYMRLSRGKISRLRQIPLSTLLVMPASTTSLSNIGDLTRIKVALQIAIAGDNEWEIIDTNEELEDVDVTQTVLSFMFSALSAVALFLCYFSLLASMVTNIHEQTKEVGVLRAIGLRGNNIVRVFVYEAFALVFASSLMGIAIGVLVGWTFQQQRALFTQLPINFIVPWSIVITVSVASIVTALLSSCAPAKRLTKQRVTSLMRTTA